MFDTPNALLSGSAVTSIFAIPRLLELGSKGCYPQLNILCQTLVGLLTKLAL